MMESGYFNNGNFREYSYFARGEFCSLETGIPGGPDARQQRLVGMTSCRDDTTACFKYMEYPPTNRSPKTTFFRRLRNFNGIISSE